MVADSMTVENEQDKIRPIAIKTPVPFHLTRSISLLLERMPIKIQSWRGAPQKKKKKEENRKNKRNWTEATGAHSFPL